MTGDVELWIVMTPGDLAAGVQGCDARCPVANAIRGAIEMQRPDLIEHTVSVGNHVAHLMPPGGFGMLTAELPSAVANWVYAFDGGAFGRAPRPTTPAAPFSLSFTR